MNADPVIAAPSPKLTGAPRRNEMAREPQGQEDRFADHLPAHTENADAGSMADSVDASPAPNAAPDGHPDQTVDRKSPQPDPASAETAQVAKNPPAAIYAAGVDSQNTRTANSAASSIGGANAAPDARPETAEPAVTEIIENAPEFSIPAQPQAATAPADTPNTPATAPSDSLRGADNPQHAMAAATVAPAMAAAQGRPDNAAKPARQTTVPPINSSPVSGAAAPQDAITAPGSPTTPNTEDGNNAESGRHKNGGNRQSAGPNVIPDAKPAAAQSGNNAAAPVQNSAAPAAADASPASATGSTALSANAEDALVPARSGGITTVVAGATAATSSMADSITSTGGTGPATAPDSAALRAAHTGVASNQIAVQINRAIQDGQDRLSVHLRPESLGRVAIDLEIGPENRLIAVIAVERPETLDLLQRDSRMLERALQDAGLKTDSGSLSFNLREEGFENPFENEDSRPAAFAGPDGEGTADAADADNHPAPLMVSDSGLDIHV